MKKDNSWVKILLWIIGGMFLIGFLFILFIILIGVAIGSSAEPTGSGNIALIQVAGVITTSNSGDLFDSNAYATSDKLVAQINDAANDPSIKAILFEINSPGGSGVASDEIARAIKESGKPTASYIREVGASGAYWIASATDYIFANRLSTVGSIGVIASYLDFSGLLNDYNVSYVRFVSGDNKDFGSPFREPTDAERARFQKQLDELHSIFIADVAENRGMWYSEVEALADGFIFTGQSAVNAGLIDEIGGYDDAVSYLESVIGEPASVVEYRDPSSFFEMLAGYKSDAAYQVGRGIGSALTQDEKPIGFRT